MGDSDSQMYESEVSAAAQGTASSSLDTALEYTRTRGLRLVPLYLVAVLPLSVLALFIIDAIGAEHRTPIAGLAAALIPATVWR